MNNIFKFKKFDVNQAGCAMKINTDGVLLGAIATQSAPKSILDVGTGTGVIAMMMAQRFPEALVTAVEIDASAAHTASTNFLNSSFSDRIAIHHGAIESFRTTEKYDLIVSNPPYFVNDLKNTEDRKRIARHADDVFFEALLAKSISLLTERGCLWLILPIKQADFVTEKAIENGLSICRQINISSDMGKPVIRRIICLSLLKVDFQPETFYIYASRGVHTTGYQQLLKDFFLAF